MTLVKVASLSRLRLAVCPPLRRLIVMRSVMSKTSAIEVQVNSISNVVHPVRSA